MAATFTCVCGEMLAMPGAGQEVFCARCNKNVAVPASAPAKPSETPPLCELVRDEQGKEFWKLTCFCGKRVRTPANASQPYGRCPKCGCRMKMPGYLLSKPKVLVSAQPGTGPVSAPSKHSSIISELVAAKSDPSSQTTAFAPAVPAKSDTGGDIIVHEVALMEDDDETAAQAAVPADLQHVNLTAALTAADRLRPQRNNPAMGRISAWPLAGMLTRVLAGFIDVTFATTLAGIVVVLALQEILPPILLTKELVVILVMLAGILNDGLVHFFWGGSIGKMLVLIVTRTAAGARPGAPLIMARAVLKWLIVPGWIIGAIDPHQRTLHDLICGTLVLKGRAKYR
jgi:hypothetical protein